MKAIKIVLGVLAAAYCVAQIVQLANTIVRESGPMRQSSIAAGAGLILISGIIAVALFRSALTRPR